MPQTLQAMFHHGNDQRRLDYTPSGADVVNGEIVNMGGLIGVCTDPEGIADGVLGALATAGVFRILKDGTAGPTFAIGATVGWDDTAKLAVAGGTGDFDLGPCVDKAAGANEDGVYVDLNRAEVN